MRRISIVALGASLKSLLFEPWLPVFWDIFKENAEAKTSATAVEFQETVMLSGKEGESRMNTSSGERRPRIEPESRSSFFRIDPS